MDIGVVLQNDPPARAVVDLAKMAEAAGLRGIKVEDPEDIGEAWDEALAESGPVLVELMAGHDFPRPSLTRFVEQGQ